MEEIMDAYKTVHQGGVGEFVMKNPNLLQLLVLLKLKRKP